VNVGASTFVQIQSEQCSNERKVALGEVYDYDRRANAFLVSTIGVRGHFFAIRYVNGEFVNLDSLLPCGTLIVDIHGLLAEAEAAGEHISTSDVPSTGAGAEAPAPAGAKRGTGAKNRFFRNFSWNFKEVAPNKKP